MNGITHFANDVIAAQSEFHAESDLLEELAFRGDSGNAEVGAAHVDTDSVVRHNEREYQKTSRNEEEGARKTCYECLISGTWSNSDYCGQR